MMNVFDAHNDTVDNNKYNHHVVFECMLTTSTVIYHLNTRVGIGLHLHLYARYNYEIK